jgi:acyl dehydratase
MLTVETPADLKNYVGKPLGVSEWLTVTQPMIDAFAQATGDFNWIHVDVERAKREMPGGKTIAHGYLTQSLIPKLSQSVYRVTRKGKSFNYGSNKVRFTSPVQSGARVRLTQMLKELQETELGTRLTTECVMEIEGAPKPAMIAEVLVLIGRE